MRQLLCDDCVKKYLPEGVRKVYERSGVDPAEYQRLRLGIAKAPTTEQRTILINEKSIVTSTEYFNCDECNKSIFPGEKCGAWTVWTELSPQPSAWEHEYIYTPEDGQARKRSA